MSLAFYTTELVSKRHSLNIAGLFKPLTRRFAPTSPQLTLTRRLGLKGFEEFFGGLSWGFISGERTLNGLGQRITLRDPLSQ